MLDTQRIPNEQRTVNIPKEVWQRPIFSVKSKQVIKIMIAVFLPVKPALITP